MGWTERISVRTFCWGRSVPCGESMDAAGIVESEVRDIIRARGIDPSSDPAEVRRLVESSVADYERRSLLAPLPVLHSGEHIAAEIYDSVAGFGELQPLLDDPEVEEIWANGPHEIFCSRGGRSELTSVTLSDTRMRDLVERMLKTSGRRLDVSSPFVDAALPDGSRLHVVILTSRDATGRSIFASSSREPPVWRTWSRTAR